MFIAPLPCTSTFCLWIFARQTFLVFKNCVTDCTSQVAEFLIFNNYGEWGGKKYDTVYAMDVFPLIYRRRLTFTGSAHVTCMATIHNYFWLTVHALYVGGIDLQTCSCYKTTRWNGTWNLFLNTAKQHGGGGIKIEVTFHNSGDRCYIYIYMKYSSAGLTSIR